MKKNILKTKYSYFPEVKFLIYNITALINFDTELIVTKLNFY